MFFYFGYGSNLSVWSLRAKGVDPLSSEPAQLQGFRLAFNLPDFFPIEGGTGNIVPGDPLDVVHGVLHGCRSADLRRLDELEAVGVAYRRIETTVTAYDGRRLRAYVYVGLPHLLDDACRPSERYLSILVRGASDMQLEPGYIEKLRRIPVHVEAPKPVFAGTNRPPQSLSVLSDQPMYVGLAGHLFDMEGARASHAYLQRLLGGHDASLLFLKRMATSTGTETIEDLTCGRLSEAQRAYLNEYLHEFAREYRYVGPLDYESVRDPQMFVGAGEGARSERPRAQERAGFRLSFVRTHTKSGRVVAPSRRVLTAAEAENDAAGHENAGSLSATHGFMPREPPSRALPSSHAAWDQLAAELPSLYGTLRLRRMLDELPLLSADVEHLPDHALLRAAQVLGILSHAYQYVETSVPVAQPKALSTPWTEVRRRLSRPEAPVISYLDLIVNNWRLIDPSARDPVRASNLRLLVPTVDNQEERVFYLTQTEILARASAIVAAVVAAQEAALVDDQEALESALVTVTGSLQRMTRESLLAIDPNPFSETYVDPVVWAKSVAPFAVPFQEGVQGPSGTSSPIFNTLDIFLGRTGFQTFLGKEIHQLRSTYPRTWRAFLASLSEVSVPKYVEASGSPRLRGLFKEVGDAYAGQNGFLGRHRMKVYGYLELAFKVGRSVTIGGFQGVLKDRTWDQVDSELEKSRRERAADLPQPTYAARVESVRMRGASGVAHVVLDVSGTGLRYETWDRCGVLPENAPELVAKTLAALGIEDKTRIPLTAEWRAALLVRRPGAPTTDLSIAELVALGKIRPLVPRAAEALHAASQSQRLKRLIDEQATYQFELWDVLEMLRLEGFEPASLLVASNPGQVLCEMIPPETFRMYSISSRPSSADTESPTRIELNVGDLAYQSPRADTGEMVTRAGTASTFVKSAAARAASIPIIIEHPPRFGLPRSARVPLVLIAGGTGLAPFLAVLDDRSRDSAAAETLVLFGARSAEALVYDDDFAQAMRAGHTSVLVALSREQKALRYGIDADGQVTRELFKDGCGRVPGLTEQPEVADRMWTLLRTPAEGGLGAHVYVCGRSSFARSAIDAIEQLFFRFATGDDADRRSFARDRMRRLFAEGRLKEETFSGEEPASPLMHIDASEVARHNDEAHGYWLLIDHRIYDLSEFVHRHPGGRHVLLGYAGMDATEGYNRVHARRPEVDASREMHLIGVLRVLPLRDRTAEVATPSGPRVVSLSSVYRVWLSALWLTVEMQNALRNDQGIQSAAVTRDERPEVRSLYRLTRAIETHERFLKSYLEVLTREMLPSLSELTCGFFASTSSTDPSSAHEPSPEHVAFVSGVGAALRKSIADLSACEAHTNDSEQTRVLDACRVLEDEDARLLVTIKEHVRESVRLFELHEARVPERAAGNLLAMFRKLEREVSGYWERVYTRLGGDAEWAGPGNPGALHAARLRLATEITFLVRNAHWSLEEDVPRRLVILRRSALPFASIEALLASNDEIIDCVRDEHARFGVVVDMRQAPSRNDPAFENAMRKLRKTLERRFARLSVLVESTVGMLQVSRLERSDGAEYLVTTSEIAASKFARGEI